MNKNYLEMVFISSDPRELLHKMDSYSPSHSIKWA